MSSWLFKRLSVLLSIIVLILLVHNVSREITPADEIVFTNLLKDNNLERLEKDQYSFSTEIVRIMAVQKLIQDLAPLGTPPIPKNHSRQPADLLAAQSGLCYDRAYTLAKLYRYLGWQTRHVALYQNNVDRYNFTELFDRKIKSHASLEVRTQRGWMIVDPDEAWIGLAIDSASLCYFEVQKIEKPITWLQLPSASMSWHLTNPTISVYGLYSRHGRFFPPYNFIPDVNWRELLYNF